MVWAPLARIRRVLGARLHLMQVRYEAAARAADLQPAMDRLGAASEVTRAQAEEASHAQHQRLTELQAAVAEQRGELAELRQAVADLGDVQTKHFRLSRAQYDELGWLREKLVALRRSDAYAATFENRRPVISVPIATYNAAELLVERAIASVQAQTYDRWEIVIVGDGCTDDTAERVAALGDDRIRFFNLPFRTLHSTDARERWLASGSAPFNRAVELCRGEWLAPLDDDDEFLPKHLESLLGIALAEQAEFTYGKLARITDGAEESYIYSFPPQLTQIGIQQTMYLRALSFFEFDVNSWAVEEPNDWNAIRRMRDAGVTMAATEEIVARYYPSHARRV